MLYNCVNYETGGTFKVTHTYTLNSSKKLVLCKPHLHVNICKNQQCSLIIYTPILTPAIFTNMANLRMRTAAGHHTYMIHCYTQHNKYPQLDTV